MYILYIKENRFALLYKDNLIFISFYLQCTAIYRSKPEPGIESTDPTLSLQSSHCELLVLVHHKSLFSSSNRQTEVAGSGKSRLQS